MSRRGLVLLIICGLGPWAVPPASAQEVAAGVTYSKTTLGGLTGHVVRIDHRVASVRVRVTPDAQRYLTIPEYVTKNGAIAAINASYYRPYYSPSTASQGEANGTTVSDGVRWQHTYDDGRLPGYFGWDDGAGRFELFPMSQAPAPWVTQALGGFRSVVRGVACDGSQPSVCSSFTARRDNQTAFGVDQHRQVTFLVVVSNAVPSEVSRFMRDLGVYDAVNLDSGGSSQLYAGSSRVASTRRVINAILVTPDGKARPPGADAGLDAGRPDADAGSGVPGDAGEEDAGPPSDAGADGGAPVVVDLLPDEQGPAGVQGCAAAVGPLSAAALATALLLLRARRRRR